MSRLRLDWRASWRVGLVGAGLAFGICGAAFAQVGNGVSGDLNSDGGAMSGANINRVNGINANGTPRQQDPGSSMTNGAGNSTMTPGVAGNGGTGATGLPGQPYVAPTIITHGTVAPSNGPSQ